MKQGMIAALTFTVVRLLQSEHRSMVEDKGIILVSAEVMNESRKESHGTIASRCEKIVKSIPRHLLGHANEVGTMERLGPNEKSANFNLSQTMTIKCDLVVQKLYLRSRINDSTKIVPFTPL